MALGPVVGLLLRALRPLWIDVELLPPGGACNQLTCQADRHGWNGWSLLGSGTAQPECSDRGNDPAYDRGASQHEGHRRGAHER